MCIFVLDLPYTVPLRCVRVFHKCFGIYAAYWSKWRIWLERPLKSIIWFRSTKNSQWIKNLLMLILVQLSYFYISIRSRIVFQVKGGVLKFTFMNTITEMGCGHRFIYIFFFFWRNNWLCILKAEDPWHILNANLMFWSVQSLLPF